MKTQLLTICLMLFGFTNVFAQAPSYTDFEWDVVGIGVAIPIDENSIKEGLSLAGEVRYNLADNFSLGLGGEMNFFDLEELDDRGGTGTIGSSFSSYLTADYYFSSSSANRAFAGLAFGGNVNGDIEIPDTGESTFTEGASGVSLAPRIGYELGHARFSAQYNIGLKEELYNYLTIRVALTLWGGYKG